MSKRLFYPILSLVSILAAILILLNTRLGAFLSDDSYYYIQPVREALAGKGLSTSPIFPPLLPIVLTLLGYLGLEPLVAVRWLHAVLFGLTALFSGLTARKMGASPFFALLAAVLVGFSENALEAYSQVLSEALCITLELLCLYLMIVYLDTHHWGWLAGSAVAASLACMTRYAALPVLAACLTVLFLFDRGRTWKFRLLGTFLYAAATAVPLAAYILRNQMILGRPLYYPTYQVPAFTLDVAIWYAYNTLSWYIPGRFLHGRELMAAGALAGLLAAAAIVIWVKARRAGSSKKPTLLDSKALLLLLFVFYNYLMLYFARGLAFLAISGPRYLIPPLLILWIAIAYLLSRLWEIDSRIFKAAAALISLVYLGYYAFRAADFTRQTSATGLGYSNIGWHQSETVAYIRQHPDLQMVSTGEVGIYFWTGRKPRLVSTFSNPAEMDTYLCENQAALFIMDQMPMDIYHLDHDAFVQNLALVKRFNDSEMYEPKPGTCP